MKSYGSIKNVKNFFLAFFLSFLKIFTVRFFVKKKFVGAVFPRPTTRFGNFTGFRPNPIFDMESSHKGHPKPNIRYFDAFENAIIDGDGILIKTPGFYECEGNVMIY